MIMAQEKRNAIRHRTNSEINRDVMSFNTVLYRTSLMHYRWSILQWFFRNNRVTSFLLMASIILLISALFFLAIDALWEQYPQWSILLNINYYGVWFPVVGSVVCIIVFGTMMKVNKDRKQWDKSWQDDNELPQKVRTVIVGLEEKNRYSSIAYPRIGNDHYATFWVLTQGDTTRDRWTREAEVFIICE